MVVKTKTKSYAWFSRLFFWYCVNSVLVPNPNFDKIQRAAIGHNNLRKMIIKLQYSKTIAQFMYTRAWKTNTAMHATVRYLHNTLWDI